MKPADSLTYRRAALQHASIVGLVIALCDTLLGNLRRAAEAMDRNDIQTRCSELVHGFNVLQQLDLMVDMENGGKTAVSLRRFYSFMRNQMLLAQFKISPQILRDQIQALVQVREAWQQLDARGIENVEPLHTQENPAQPHLLGGLRTRDTEDNSSSFSCSI